MRTWLSIQRSNSTSGLLVLVLIVGGLIQVGRWLASVDFGLTGQCRMTRRSQSASNLRQIGFALEQYRNTHDQFPPGAIYDPNAIPRHGWPSLILPYVDQVDLANSLNFSRPWDDPTPGLPDRMSNQTVTSTGIGIYRNPGVPTPPATLDYASNAWVLGGVTARRESSITDGLAQTIFLGEAAGNYQPWGSPVHWRDPNLGINRSPNGFGSPFPGGANFLFGDCSVRFLRNQTPLSQFRALCTPNGHEPVDMSQLDD